MRVIIESPFNASTPEQIAANVAYAWRCVKDSLDRGEAPFASHLFYPNVLPETPKERAQGIDAGLQWGEAAELTAVYTDLGISDGMNLGIKAAWKVKRRVEYRSITATEASIKIMRVGLVAEWYDFWIGVYYNKEKRRLYVLPIPCLGFWIERTAKPFPNPLSKREPNDCECWLECDGVASYTVAVACRAERLRAQRSSELCGND